MPHDGPNWDLGQDSGWTKDGRGGVSGIVAEAPRPYFGHYGKKKMKKKNVRVITLCGSRRFQKEFRHINRVLSLRGFVVLSICDDNPDFAENVTQGHKLILDTVHLRKIDMSDAILVIDCKEEYTDNPSTAERASVYIGEETIREIAYAQSGNKQIFRYSKQDLDELVSGPCAITIESLTQVYE